MSVILFGRCCFWLCEPCERRWSVYALGKELAAVGALALAMKWTPYHDCTPEMREADHRRLVPVQASA